NTEGKGHGEQRLRTENANTQSLIPSPRKMSIDDVCNLSESLLYPAPLTIRVNLSYITREEVIVTLKKNEIECESCKLSPSGIMLTKRTQLNTLDIFKQGLIEVQDEGSQLISYALFKRFLSKVQAAKHFTLRIFRIIQEKLQQAMLTSENSGNF
ncbi:MAG: hypothetical protein M1419_00195, partial [Bacteroidetes bacterium]|nr:hypothetical protein [Bacteroidota bacterium]